jgi:hypothetical protein
MEPIREYLEVVKRRREQRVKQRYVYKSINEPGRERDQALHDRCSSRAGIELTTGD